MTSTNQTLTQMAIDYARIEKAIVYLSDHVHSQPTLSEVSDHVHMSEYHFQRLFSRWAGLSPKRYLEYLTITYAKELLDSTDDSLLSTALSTGLSGTGRLHDLFVTLEAVSPGEYRKRGANMEIYYGLHESPFGSCLVCTTDRGVCGLAFVSGTSYDQELDRYRESWADAVFIENREATVPVVQCMFSRGETAGAKTQPALRCLVQGTNFQVKVWEALLSIPNGSVTTYSKIARFIGMPKAYRAVANAVGANPVAYLIPCHRVIRTTGALGGYRYGLPRKQAILAWESIA